MRHMFLTQIAFTKKDLPEKQHMYTVRLAKRTFFLNTFILFIMMCVFFRYGTDSFVILKLLLKDNKKGNSNS